MSYPYKPYKPTNMPNVGDEEKSISTKPYIPYDEPRLGEYYDRYKRLDAKPVNDKNYQENNYDENFTKKFNEQLSVEQEPHIEYTKRNNYLTINSKDRDYIQYPSSSQYVIDIDPEYRNITSIELITAIIPDTNNVTNQPYLLLNIKELDTLMDSPGKELSESFALLQLNSPTVPNSFIQIDKRTFENTVLNYHTPKARLSRLTISITDSLGNIFDFGGNGTNTQAYQVTLIFKIVTLDTSRKSLNQRNIY